MIRLVMSSVAMVAFVSAASAATLSDVSGSVLVDSGKGFQKVSAASDVSVGSRVMVTRGGKAVLAYADGCKKTLSANSITTVVKADACTQTAQVAGQFGQVTPNYTNLTSMMTAGIVVSSIVVPFLPKGNDPESQQISP